MEDKSGNTIVFLDEKDAATISGYVIYKTQVWNAPNDVVLKTQSHFPKDAKETSSGIVRFMKPRERPRCGTPI